MVSDPGGLNHRAAGCLPATDDQTQYVHPFARLGLSPVRLNTSTAGQAGREARGADPRRGSVRPSEASPTAEKRERDERSLGTEVVRVRSGTAARRVKSGCQVMDQALTEWRVMSQGAAAPDEESLRLRGPRPPQHTRFGVWTQASRGTSVRANSVSMRLQTFSATAAWYTSLRLDIMNPCKAPG